MTDELQLEQPDVLTSPSLLNNIKQLVSTDAAIASAENLLKNLKEEKDRLNKAIGDVMVENDIPMFGIAGFLVRLSTDYLCSVTEDNVENFHKWLVEHDVNIYDVAVVVPCEDVQSANDIAGDINKTGRDASKKLSVHWKKLSSNIKRLIEEDGITPPEDLAKLFIRRNVIVKT